MLQIKTIKNALVSDESKNGYCFRSTCLQSLSQKQLAKEMAEWNSSFTEADCVGMLSVMENIMIKYLAKGYNVELPFGTLRPNVTGTCSSIQDGFTPDTGDHTLGFIFNANESTVTSVKAKLEYKQVPPDITTEARLYRIASLLNDASESDNLRVSGGKMLRLHGRNLSFDITDSAQGVFLENETSYTRIDTYTRRGTNIVDVVIPATLAAGAYTVSIVTKPGSTYFTAKIDSVVTVA